MEVHTKRHPDKPHFFKPFLSSCHKELWIPNSFIKYLVKEWSKKAVLRSGRNKVWNVKLNGRCIVDGWMEFVKDHDLHEGDFFVFRHEGNMVFDVLIFDPTCCERQYPPFDHIDVNDDDDFGEKKNNTKSKEKSVKHYFEDSEEIVEKKKYSMTSEAVNTTSTSLAFGSPSFAVTLMPSFKKKRQLYIPKYFAELYGLNKGCREMKLIDENQRSWPVELSNSTQSRTYICGHGWHDLCAAYRLKEGNTLMFELINQGNNPIMTFHRLEGCSNFCCVFTPTASTKNRLIIPKDFARSNGLIDKGCKMILRNEKGRSWEAMLRYQKCDGVVYIGRGWREFAIANGVKEGHTFKFELVRGGKFLTMKFYGVFFQPHSKKNYGQNFLSKGLPIDVHN